MFRTDYSESRFIDAFERIATALEKLTERTAQPQSELRTQSFDDIRSLMRAGRKIDAIKLFRTLTGAGLKDAKDQVEAIKDYPSFS